MNHAPIGVMGGGAFGRGLAAAARSAGHDVLLQTRDATRVRDARIRTTPHIGALAACDLIFIAVRSAHMEEAARALGPHLDGRHLLVHVSRGLADEEMGTLTAVLDRHTAARRVGALAGPITAAGLAEGRPGGAVVGSQFSEVTDAVRAALSSKALLIYHTSDVRGVELASAAVGALALTTGFAAGCGYGPESISVLATRGVHEAALVGRALGANPETFGGLAGMGDLLSAVAGDGRPSWHLGRALAQGAPLEEALADLGVHDEGQVSAARFAQAGERLGIEVPIFSVIARIADGTLGAEGAAAELMARRVGKE